MTYFEMEDKVKANVPNMTKIRKIVKNLPSAERYSTYITPTVDTVITVM